ncbi:hypothetical protein KPATCC21470_3189 [Kitasatospora purpeofusca]
MSTAVLGLAPAFAPRAARAGRPVLGPLAEQVPALAAFLLLPWTALLVAAGDTAWAAFDLCELAALLRLDAGLRRRGAAAAGPAAVVALLLAGDALVDIATALPGQETLAALIMAGCAELPLAALCLALGLARTGRPSAERHPRRSPRSRPRRSRRKPGGKPRQQRGALLVLRGVDDHSRSLDRTEPETGVVEPQQAHLRHQEALQAVPRPQHVVPLPGRVEHRRGLAQPAEQRPPGGLGPVVAHPGPEPGDHDVPLLLVVHQHLVEARGGEGQPHQIAVLGRQRGQIADDPGVLRVVGQDVVAGVDHRGGVGGHPVQRHPDRRRDGRALPDRRRILRAGQGEQMGPLTGVEQQGARHRVQYLHGHLDLAPLLQPRVPGDADGGDLRHLLTAQPRRPPPTGRRQPHLLGGDPLPATAQERRQLLPPRIGGHFPGGCRDGGQTHSTSMRHSSSCCQVLLIPG